MGYSLKETFHTLQGEGAQAGRAAVFARFAGCNLWSGREQDRAAAACWFCDTDFVGTDGPGGGRFASAAELAHALRRCWDEATEGGAGSTPWVVFTGGEPLLQLDSALVVACHERGFAVAVETNGTLPVPEGVDWICVSPKPGTTLALRYGNELKLVWPGGVDPRDIEAADLRFDHWFIQPMDGPDREANTLAAARFCRHNPRWRLSLQIHKLVGFP